MRELLFIALVLACPLMMILMMRGHGHGAHAGRIGGLHDHGDISSEPKSAAELRRQRYELDRLDRGARGRRGDADSDQGRSAMSTAAVTDHGGRYGPSR